MDERDEKRLLDRTVSRRSMLKTSGIGAGVAAATLAAGLGIDVADAQVAGDDPQTILNLGSTAEALAITAFHSIITQSTFYGRLAPHYQNYLKSALTQEQAHFDLWVASGGKPLANQFFFPNGILENLALYVFVTDVLEGVFIGAYLAATRRFAELNRPDLAWTVASVMGIEAEHKALNRAMGITSAGSAAGMENGITNSPTREPFEPATLFQVSQAVPTLGPVLMGGTAPASAGALVAGVEFGLGPVMQPTAAQVRAVGNPLTPVRVPLQAFSKTGKRN
ncbi:MAG: hypothetical protein AVDCRST_MAG26-3645 [uncultured Chloroflexia bacterium]|uniref:Dessication-associated protein n=1 Tax=uncultured Chloroflexia bacterium TaxID=1672391 RepID=A0A6J4JQG2_9CHLR|nr:MAG: hypothetical protein AVDCRST_MAG26-3645 [uncultured Chloroflexia bacterium]